MSHKRMRGEGHKSSGFRLRGIQVGCIHCGAMEAGLECMCYSEAPET
jgi:hypothetical protein